MPFVTDGLAACTEYETQSNLALLRKCKDIIRGTHYKCLYILVENEAEQRAYITIKTRLSTIIWIDKHNKNGEQI